MGKRKLELDYIVDAKKRRKTYDTRKQGLIKKLHELTTLCDVKACAIIYDGSSPSPDIWPSNPDVVREMIDKYKNGQPGKPYSLPDFFKDKKQKVEEDLNMLRKKNNEAKYATPVEAMNMLTEPELRNFAAYLGNKIMGVKSRIEELKRKSNRSEFSQTQCSTLMNQQQQGGVLPVYYNSYFCPIDQQGYLPVYNQYSAW